jgi:hypothetical protein
VKTFGLRIPARRRVTAGEGGAVDSCGGSGAGSETRGSAPADSERAFGADESGTRGRAEDTPEELGPGLGLDAGRSAGDVAEAGSGIGEL